MKLHWHRSLNTIGFGFYFSRDGWGLLLGRWTVGTDTGRSGSGRRYGFAVGFSREESRRYFDDPLISYRWDLVMQFKGRLIHVLKGIYEWKKGVA